MEFKLVHPEKALSPMLVRVSGITKEDSLVPANEDTPIDVSVAGKLIELNPVPLNAPSPIDIKVEGKLIDSNLQHDANTDLLIFVRPFGKVTEVNEPQ